VGVEKLDTYEGITIKVLLDSSAIGMFMDKRIAARHGFKLQKLERPIMKCLLQRSYRKNKNGCM